jgi:ribosomal protein L11 methyltransferase
VNISTSEHPGWIEISIHVHSVAHEGLSAFLFDLGCEGIVSEAMGDSTLQAYLPFQKDLEEVRSRTDLFLENLKEIFPEIRSFKLSLNRIEDQDWGLSWRRFFRPDRITPKLMVIPAWEPVPKNTKGRVIRIDPGLAFGTGQHPTTRMCLEGIEKLSFSGSWSMLDVGTGSGILAIYGAMLGAGRIAAIDIDPEAISWAKKNIELNGLIEGIELSSRPLEEWEDGFSIITANLIPDGYLILSGILADQVKGVEEALAEYGFHENQVLFQEEWACIITRKLNKY